MTPSPGSSSRLIGPSPPAQQPLALLAARHGDGADQHPLARLQEVHHDPLLLARQRPLGGDETLEGEEGHEPATVAAEDALAQRLQTKPPDRRVPVAERRQAGGERLPRHQYLRISTTVFFFFPERRPSRKVSTIMTTPAAMAAPMIFSRWLAILCSTSPWRLRSFCSMSALVTLPLVVLMAVTPLPVARSRAGRPS